MAEISTLLLFSGACLALTLTPGPDMLLITSRSLSQGRRAGFASLAGIQLGTYCHALAAALGLSQLLITVPLAFDAVRLLGAGYLLYLAWKTLRSGSNLQASAGLQAVPAKRIFSARAIDQYSQPENGTVCVGIISAVYRSKGWFCSGADVDPGDYFECDRFSD